MRTKYRNLTLSVQIALFSLFFALVCSVIISLANRRIYAKILYNQTGQLLCQTLELVEANIDSLMQSIEESSRVIVANSDISKALNYEKFSYNLEVKNASIEYIRRWYSINSYASSVHLFNRYGDSLDVSISNVNYPLSHDIKQLKAYEQIRNENGGYLLLTDTDNFFVRNADNQFISMARSINDINSQIYKGILVINISKDFINSGFSQLVNNKNIGITICDKNNNVILGNVEKSVAQNIIEEVNETGKSFITNNVNGEACITALVTNQYGWRIIGTFKKQSLNTDMRNTYYINLLFFLFNGIVLFLITNMFVEVKLEPVKKIIDMMSHTSLGGLNKANIKVSSQDIKTLQLAYNSMVDELQKLIYQIKKNEEQKRKIEFSMLQTQIKPHFLYNTLDSISGLALMEDCKTVYEVTMSLSNFFRVSLSSGREIITIAQEMDAIESYVNILLIRYNNSFQVLWDIAENVKEVPIPKLSIQPFVENAISHGIRPKGGFGTLKIEASKQNDHAVIKIIDDGVGIDNAQVKSIMERDSDTFGISSTIKRLNIYYRNKANIQIIGEKGAGTKVFIQLPMEILDDK